MKLLTSGIIRKLEKHPFGSQDGKLDDAEVLVKFFGGSACTWLVTEGEQQEDGDWLFYGKITLGYGWEWGYFTFSELEKLKFPPFELGVQRDMYVGNKATVGLLVEEESTAADEGFAVSSVGLGKQFCQLAEQLPFAADPLEDRLKRFAACGHEVRPPSVY